MSLASMAAPPPIVEFKDVVKRYGAGPAVLDGLSFSVAPGEFVTILGPSGGGKSTLLRLVAGLSPVTGGRLTVDGAAAPAVGADGLAFVFQEPTLLPWLTVAGNVELPQRLRGIPAAARRKSCGEALALVGLDGQASRYPHQLSGGQKMRVSLARALARTPRILLLDEPFGALDALTRERLNEELLALHRRRGWTAFFVTHSAAEAVFLSQRVLILTPAPARLAADVAIDLPRLRDAGTRLTRAYQDQVTDVTRRLRELAAAA